MTKPDFFCGLACILSSGHPAMMTEGHEDECMVRELPS